MAFKVEVIAHLGDIERMKDHIIVEIVRYGDRAPVINVQVEYIEKDSGEKKRGKRPAYDLETISKLLPLFQLGKEMLEKLKSEE